LAPGDLLFFHHEGGVPGHVGIYIGNNQFIHAPHTGDVVKISTLDSHYDGVYVGAVRPY
jgi:cell wall-associated NlpC family hydrolase